jgi:hypothetical protein
MIIDLLHSRITDYIAVKQPKSANLHGAEKSSATNKSPFDFISKTIIIYFSDNRYIDQSDLSTLD